MKYSYLFLLLLAGFSSCSRNQEQAYDIKRFWTCEGNGSFLFILTCGGIKRHFIVQGLNIRRLHEFEKTKDEAFAVIDNLEVTVVSSQDIYSDVNVESDSFRIVATYADTPSKPAHAPVIMEETLPHRSCRFIGHDDDPSPGFMPESSQDTRVSNGKLRFSTHSQQHAGKLPHHAPGP